MDLKAQHAEVRAELDAAVREVFDTGAFVLGGPVEAFEKEFAAALGVRHAIGVNSGTDALLLILDAVRMQRGAGNVVTTPFSFFATAEAVLQAGLELRFADIEADSFNLDPRATAAAADRSTVAVMPVHLYGRCADTDALRVGGAALVEDAAQAVGATFRGRPAGDLGDAAGFSFYVTKNLGAAGDAGAVTTGDADLAALVRSLRAHGETRSGDNRSYHYVHVGRNSRLDGLQAAVLRVKLRRLAAWQEAREANARAYDEWLAGIDGVRTPAPPDDGVHVWHQYVVRAARLDALKDALAEQGIETRVFYPQPLHLQPALAHLGLGEGAFPEAERAAGEDVALRAHERRGGHDGGSRGTPYRS